MYNDFAWDWHAELAKRPNFLLSVNKCDDENRKMLLLEIIWLYLKRVSITALQIPVLLNEQNIFLVVLSDVL